MDSDYTMPSLNLAFKKENMATFLTGVDSSEEVRFRTNKKKNM